jgi:hypothetical protein
MSDWFGLSQLTSKSMLLEGRRAALIPQLQYPFDTSADEDILNVIA